MRDQRKPKSYFEKYLEYQYERISTKEMKLNQCSKSDSDKASRISVTLMGYKLDALIAEFSIGNPKEALKKRLHDCCDTAKLVKTLSYETSLRLLCISILLDDSCIKEIVPKILLEYGDDKLISCLVTYITKNVVLWEGTLMFPDIYCPLDVVFSSKNTQTATQTLMNYLSGWYQSCQNCSWFNAAESKHDVYYGYWSFESAAIAKILNANEDTLKQNVYFPTI